MRTIQKIQEPRSLAEHRAAHGNYGNYADKDSLRAHLVAEQKGLCCYCQRRILPDGESMKIEHWRCQTRHEDEELSYSNILGACLGGEGKTLKKQHCDTRKGDNDLCICPSDPAHRVSQRVKFLGDGEITSDEDPVKNALNEILNLNLGWLKANRKAALEAFQMRLGKRPLNAAREIQNWDGTQAGELREYAQVIVYWLQKKINRGAP